MGFHTRLDHENKRDGLSIHGYPAGIDRIARREFGVDGAVTAAAFAAIGFAIAFSIVLARPDRRTARLRRPRC